MPRKGNPLWSSGRAEISNPDEPRFYKLQRKLGLQDHEVLSNSKMRQFAKRNVNKCYVPSDLLRQWGIKAIDEEYGLPDSDRSYYAHTSERVF